MHFIAFFYRSSQKNGRPVDFQAQSLKMGKLPGDRIKFSLIYLEKEVNSV